MDEDYDFEDPEMNPWLLSGAELERAVKQRCSGDLLMLWEAATA